MEKKRSCLGLFPFLCLLLFAFNAKGFGQKVDAPSIRSAYLFADKGVNYKNFVVQVPVSGRYYCNFWLQPADCGNGSFTAYRVSVNDAFAGEIMPECAGWQTIAMNEVPSLMLDAGVNIISVSCPSPEIPDVETVWLSNDAVTGTSASYEAYVEKAKQGIVDPPQDELYSDRSFTGGILLLKYSFSKLYSFEEGQEVSFSSSSATPHAIDFFFRATPRFSTVATASVSDGNKAMVKGSASDNIMVTPGSVYIPATSDEMQGLSWKRNSEPSLVNTSLHEAVMKVKIPKTGLYMVMLRSAEDRTLGVANFTFNGNSHYSDVPIYFSDMEQLIPADGNAYQVYASSPNQDSDDPMLFVRGNAADRIVGYNDDAPSDVLDEFGLGQHDSYLCQVYKVKTSGVHVCNYSSNNPESDCYVDVWPLDDVSRNLAFTPVRRNSAPLHPTTTGLSGRIYEYSSSIPVGDTDDVKSVQVFSLMGEKLASFSGDRCRAGLSVHDFSGKKGETYVMVMDTDKGMIVKKILVK